MALFVNSGDEHVTIPDGRGGALIVPAGCEVVEGPDGALVALPRLATAPAVVSFDDDPDDALSAIVGGMIADGSLAEVPQGGIVEDQLVTFGDGSPELFVPADAVADEPGPFADAPVVAPSADEPATTKRRRGGSAA